MLHSVSRLEVWLGLHFSPFHFMESSCPDCPQQTSFKTFRFKVLLSEARKSTATCSCPEFWLRDLAGGGQPSSWPRRSLALLFFPERAGLVLVLSRRSFTGDGSPELHSNQEELLLLFGPCKHPPVAIIMALFKYLMRISSCVPLLRLRSTNCLFIAVY